MLCSSTRDILSLISTTLKPHKSHYLFFTPKPISLSLCHSRALSLFLSLLSAPIVLLHQLVCAHNTALGDAGVRVLWSALARNRALKSVSFAHCAVGEYGVLGLVDALQRGSVIEV